MNHIIGIRLLVALIFSITVYVLTLYLDFSPITIALVTFISALLSPFITQTNKVSEHNKSDVKTLYVGNLPYRANEAAVRTLFSEHGQVFSIRLMKDKHTGKRRGFGFVEIASKDCEKVISTLNDSEFQQRTLKVREAKERIEKNH